MQNQKTKRTIQMSKHSNKIYAIMDIWHGPKNIKEVRSDDSSFNNDYREFFGWIIQHGGDIFEAYEVT